MKFCSTITTCSVVHDPLVRPLTIRRHDPRVRGAPAPWTGLTAGKLLPLLADWRLSGVRRQTGPWLGGTRTNEGKLRGTSLRYNVSVAGLNAPKIPPCRMTAQLIDSNALASEFRAEVSGRPGGPHPAAPLARPGVDPTCPWFSMQDCGGGLILRRRDHAGDDPQEEGRCDRSRPR